jgi:hypothetical protein
MISRQKLIEELDFEIGHSLSDARRTMLIDIIEIIESQPPADQWIPVAERLPEERQKVLVTLETFTGVRFVRTDQIIDGNWWQWNSDNVTAWLPLPEPYKGVE